LEIRKTVTAVKQLKVSWLYKKLLIYIKYLNFNKKLLSYRTSMQLGVDWNGKEIYHAKRNEVETRDAKQKP